MKKQFKTTFLFAAALLWALTLAGCGEDVVPGDPGTDPGTGTRTKKETKFSSKPGGTRTSMASTPDAGDKYPFYWETGDKIWVDQNNDGTFSLPNSSMDINSSDRNLANFFFNNVELTGKTYDLVYTGNSSINPKANEVTILAEQTQSGWNSSDHLGTSGDCGVATATQDAIGDYSFELEHKAAYLVLAPFLNTAIDEVCKLTKIEIVSNNTIAGTYPFNKTNGIVTTSTIENPSSTITLNCSGDLPMAKASSNACFVVLQPGEHTLTIKYTITSVTQNKSFTFVKDAFTKNFKANGVTTVRHELIPMMFTGSYRTWNSNNPWPTAQETVSGPLAPPTQASTGWWVDVPNANEMYWYIKNGDPRWDAQTPWIFTNNRYWTGSAWVSQKNYMATGGVWMKKRTVILANANGTMMKCGGSSHGGNGPTYCTEHGVSNMDMRANVLFAADPYWNLCLDISTHYQTAGKPSDVTDYFFLPATGYMSRITKALTNWGTESIYWSKSPARSIATEDENGNPINPPVEHTTAQAWRFMGKENYVVIAYVSKGYGAMASDYWFQ